MFILAKHAQKRGGFYMTVNERLVPFQCGQPTFLSVRFPARNAIHYVGESLSGYLLRIIDY